MVEASSTDSSSFHSDIELVVEYDRALVPGSHMQPPSSRIVQQCAIVDHRHHGVSLESQSKSSSLCLDGPRRKDLIQSGLQHGPVGREAETVDGPPAGRDVAFEFALAPQFRGQVDHLVLAHGAGGRQRQDRDVTKF